jgi:hypothetical protein
MPDPFEKQHPSNPVRMAAPARQQCETILLPRPGPCSHPYQKGDKKSKETMALAQTLLGRHPKEIAGRLMIPHYRTRVSIAITEDPGKLHILSPLLCESKRGVIIAGIVSRFPKREQMKTVVANSSISGRYSIFVVQSGARGNYPS